MRWRSRRLAAAVLGILLALPITPASEARETTPFREDFDTKLHPAVWYVSDGWSNGAHQNCTWRADHVRLYEGVLHLILTDTADGERSYGCGEIRTRKRYKYGVLEARMRVPAVSGTNANVFTFIGAPQNKPHHEIDIEFLGKRVGMMQTNYYYEGDGRHEDITVVDGADTKFRTYAIAWEPDRLRWYVDGELVRTVSGDSIPHLAQNVFLSLWSTDKLTAWMGEFRYPGAPVVMEVDWIAFTPAGSVCAFEGSLACALNLSAP